MKGSVLTTRTWLLLATAACQILAVRHRIVIQEINQFAPRRFHSGIPLGGTPLKTGRKAEASASRVTYLTGLARPVNRPWQIEKWLNLLPKVLAKAR